MRFATLCLILLSWCPANSFGDDADQAAALVDKAIRAHGGADRLARMQLMTRNVTGTMFLFGQESPFKDELILSLPDKWKLTLDSGPAGQTTTLLIVVNGDKGWQSAGASIDEIDKTRMSELKEEAYVLWLSTLVPLRKESGFELKTIPDEDVDGKPALGIQVSRQGHANVKLYFDKQSLLLVKEAHRAKEAGIALDKEYLYGNHKIIDGVRVPTKYVELTNGKKFAEVSNITYKFVTRIDPKQFERP